MKGDNRKEAIMSKGSKKRAKGKGSKRRPKELTRLRKWILTLFSCIISILLHPSATFCQDQISWQRSDEGIGAGRITAVCVVKDSPKVLYVGVEGCIYKSVDYGKEWYRVLFLKGSRKQINTITHDPVDSHKIYAATEDGLYITLNGGKNWKRSFKGKDSYQREVNYVAADKEYPSVLIIGTKKGLFLSKDGGVHWEAISSFINKEVYSITFSEKGIYVSADDGVYVCQDVIGLWDRIYVAQQTEQRAADEDNGDDDNGALTGTTSYITNDEGKLYLASEDGLYLYEEAGKEWYRFKNEGLLSNDINYVLAYCGLLYAASSKGVFHFNKEEDIWTSTSSGLATLDVNMMDISPEEGLLYAATDKGFYKAPLDRIRDRDDGLSGSHKGYLRNEPTIFEIQQAAIEYAEVSPKKIEWMRQSARNKAWLPKVTAGLDGNIYRTIDLDRGSTSTPDFYIEGPTDKNWGWDVSATWDLGELIWNDDQTNIDVRSRLMVQLRNDVLDEITKLYFERQRLQLELYDGDIKSDNDKSLKKLRLTELTANIDALTGGYLSRHIEN